MANEKRLIDANDVLWRLETEANYRATEYPVVSATLRATMMLVESSPTVDAVPVVRCKDCKHYDNSEGICWCKLNSKFFPGGLDWHGFPEDGFCSYGERK